MLTYPTLDQLRALRLEGMARALEEQHAHPAIEALTFDERLAQLIDRELDRKSTRLNSSHEFVSRMPSSA